ncbi:MAG: hypothetical protein IJN20_01010 [Oscillospiraceae bacterium]|nr:hypothetical protein [Oscillospiraceae bacterium]
MTRRIAAAALALIMLLCAFPVNAKAYEVADIDKPAQPYMSCPVYEENRTYYEGEYVWVLGSRTKPSADSLVDKAKYQWKKYGMIRRCSEGLLEHVHDEDCNDENFEMICGFAQEHIHDTASGCMGWDAYYLHRVVINENYKPENPENPDTPENPDDPDTPDTPDGPEFNIDDGFDEATGEMYFEILCVNAKGEPLPYVSFGIATAQTDAYGNIKYDSEGTPLMNSNGGVAIKTTNKEGRLRFNALEKHLGAGKFQPWILYQDAAAFIKSPNTNVTGPYYNQYFCCDAYWSMPSGLKFVLAKETIRDKETPVIQPGYANGVLTYVNERVRCLLDINVKFVDEDGNSIAPSSCTVTLTPNKTVEGYPKEIAFPLEQSSRNDSWGDSFYNLPAARYTVESDEPAAISGYSYLNTTYELLVKEKDEATGEWKDTWKETDFADLGTDLEVGIFRITHHYEQGIVTNRIRVRTVDEDGTGRSGATYQLYDPYSGSGLVAEFTDTDPEFYIIDQDVSHAVQEGETKTLMLMQTEEPTYHIAADEMFEIDVTKTNGVVSMILRDENGDDGAVEGIQTATFVSKKSDQSNTVIVRAVEATEENASGAELTGGQYTVYENDEAYESYDLSEATELRLEEFADLAKSGESRVFELKQTSAPKGYFPSEETYTITVTMEGGKPKVTLAKAEENPGLWKNVARALGLSQDARGDYGEQIAQFHNEKAPGNRIVMKAFDKDQPDAELEAEYTLSLLGSDQVIADNLKGSLDMTAYGRNEETIRYSLKQSTVQDGYDLTEQEFHITVTKRGGNVYTEVTEVNGDGSNIASTAEEQVLSFRNQKKPGVAKISITMAENEIQWPQDAVVDNDFVEQLQDTSYTFLLKWSHNGAENETELSVKPGSMAVFEAELPQGANYEVTAVLGTTPDHTTKLSSKYSGEVSENQLEKTTNVTATNTYKIAAGNYVPQLNLVKADAADVNKVLPGATFDLRGPDGNAFLTVVSDANGVIDISQSLQEPAVHVMVETDAPAGYTKLEEPLMIRIGYDYTPEVIGEETVLVQDLKATATHPDALEQINGTYYIKNEKEQGDALIHLTLDMQEPNWGKARKTDTGYLKDAYHFALSWQNADGKKQTDVVSLSPQVGKNQATFKLRVPLDVEYTIRSIGEDIIYNTTFSGDDIASNGTGKLTSAAGANITASVKHNFVAGKYKPDLYMVKVNARNLQRTLAGAKFSLKDETGIILKTYLTQKDGTIEILNDVLDNYPTSYTLTEIAAPEEYVKLKKPIDIVLEYEYVPSKGADGTITATQNLVANVYHESVEKGADGWYYIKNAHTSDIPQTGDLFDPVLWIGLLAVSAAGLAAVAVCRKKKRKVQ